MTKENEIFVIHCGKEDLSKRIPADHKKMRVMKAPSVIKMITAGKPHTKRKIHKMLRPNKPMKINKKKHKEDRHARN